EQTDKSSPYTVSSTIHSGKWIVDLVIMSDKDIQANDTWCEMTVCYNQDKRNKKKTDKLIWNNEDTATYPHYSILTYQFFFCFACLKTDKLIWNNEDTATFSLNNIDHNQVFQTEKKWYKGDFHTHTIYSDGEMTREENIEMANKQSLDFFVATDHNIVPTSWYDQSNILVIPRTEVTSTLGHFNIINLNTSPFVKNRLRDMYDEKGTNEIIAQDYGDALISINHPFLKGCPWIYRDTNMGNIDTIEIINDPTYPDNLEATEHALTAWNLLLNDGYKITGIGGSDSHLRPDDHYDGSSEPSLIGDPGTYVYCDELTASNLMNSVRKGY